MSFKELKENMKKAPSLKELDGWVPVGYEDDTVYGRKMVGKEIMVKPFKPEGVWKRAMEFLKERDRILREIGKDQEYEFVSGEEEEKEEEKVKKKIKKQKLTKVEKKEDLMEKRKKELEVELLEEKLSLVKKKKEVCDRMLEANKDEDVQG